MPVYGQIKPTGIPTINWRHPMAQNLVFYAFDTGLGEIIDLVSGRKATYSGTKPSVRTSRYGQALQFNNTTASFLQDSRIQATQVTGLTQAFSYACGYMQTATAPNFTPIFGRLANSGGSQPFWNWDFEVNANNAGQNTVRASCTNGGTQSTPSNWTGNANNVYTTIVNNIFSGTQHFYAQNSLIASNGSCSGQVNTGADLLLGNVGFVYWAGFWGRPLQEIPQLTIDPYSFLNFGEYPVYATRSVSANTNAVVDSMTEEVLFSETGSIRIDSLTEEVLFAETGSVRMDSLVQEVLTTQYVPQVRRSDRHRRVR